MRAVKYSDPRTLKNDLFNNFDILNKIQIKKISIWESITDKVIGKKET